MKNLKKIVAAFAAATMVMSIASVAFADVSANIEPLEGNVGVSLENYDDFVDSTYQWTVIIIAKANENKTNLEAADLFYINQGNLADDFWTNMGTKGESLADGDYIMRIGSNSSDWTVRDFNFNISTSSGGESITVTLGDVNDDTEVNISDISPIINHILGELLTGKLLVAADTNEDGDVNISDISPIINYILGTGDLGTATYTAG